MEDLERFQRVNACESRQELFQAVADIVDENGNVQGIPAQSVIININQYFLGMAPSDVIMKEFGLRQQAMYLNYYGK